MSASVPREGRARRWVRTALLGVLIVGGAIYTVSDAFTIVIYVSYATVGAILVIRRSRNPIGWILLGIALGFAGTTPPPNLDVDRLQAGTAAWDQFVYAWVSGWAGSFSMLMYLALTQLFPTGRLPEGGRSRRLAQVLLTSAAILLVVTALWPTVPYNTGVSAGLALPNRFGLLSWLPMLVGFDPGFLFLPLLVLLVIAVGSMLLRYRRSTGVLRLQLRWLAAAVAFVALAVLFGLTSLAIFGEGIGLLAWLPALVAYPSVPAAIAIAVLRYRLYEIDRIISRTIGWAIVTATLVGAFAAGVLVLQAALSGLTQGQTLAVAASTLVAFALFQPVRTRIQRAVDHRFDRARYDAQRTADAFAERVRNEVDLPRISGALLRTTGSAVRPVAAALWLRGSPDR